MNLNEKYEIQEELSRIFLAEHKQRKFHEFEKDMVYYEKPNGEKHYFEPYIPFIGDNYDEYRILVYASAQNLADHPTIRSNYYKMDENSVYRLYPQNPNQAFSFKNIEIAPVQCGVFPALIGVFLYATYGVAFSDLEEIVSMTAMTNFHKYSLWKTNIQDINTTKQENLDPKKMDSASARNYSEKMINAYVEQEINFLQPKTIISFRGQYERRFKEILPSDCRYEIVNDTAWILYGGSGKLTKDGEWGYVLKYNNEILDALIDNYCKQIIETNWGRYPSKKEAIRIYLKWYFFEFNRSKKEGL